ncbi:MAG: hypothetical protein ACX94C_09490 [Phycisphaerales bacterium]
MIRASRCVLVCLIAMLLCASGAHAQRESFSAQVADRVDALLVFEGGADRKALEARYNELAAFANTVASRAGVRQMDAMTRCEGALGMIQLVLSARSEDPGALVGKFRDHPAFMVELGLLVHEKDNAQGVVTLAERLMDERGEQLDAYPALGAALCVVHDMQGGEPYSRWVNENTPESGDPVAIFDFFVSNARSMAMNPADLPALALVFVVDVTETPEQLQWAHNRFHSHPAIKDRFFEIEYDYQHFQQNRPKRVVSEPGAYNLEKINRYGGVCADQAYYSMSVAKACGIPSGYVIARGADVSHAWVGFVEGRGRRLNWNFDAGRYDDYKNLRGNMVNPQTRESESDGRVGVLGGAMSAQNEQVLASMAAARVVGRMHAGFWSLDEDVELDARGNNRETRGSTVEDQLDLLKATLSKCAGVPGAWDMVVEIAASGEMDEKHMDVWARAVMQLAGRQHQDFAFDFLVDLIATEEDAKRQHEMWEWAFGQFRRRPDLASAVRFSQGKLWAENDNLEYAWIAYNDVVNQFINDGPMVVSALGMMEKMLADQGKRNQIIPVLEQATRRVHKPGDMSTQFARQSNYFRIHAMLANAYQRAGRSADSKRIRTQIGA